MIIEMFGIYDQSVQRYIQVVPYENEEVARMNLKSAFLQGLLKVANLAEYPEKFDVYLVANFNDKDGTYENCQRRLVFNFGEFVNKEK